MLGITDRLAPTSSDSGNVESGSIDSGFGAYLAHSGPTKSETLSEENLRILRAEEGFEIELWPNLVKVTLDAIFLTPEEVSLHWAALGEKLQAQENGI